jgi:hypothetical protein
MCRADRYRVLRARCIQPRPPRPPRPPRRCVGTSALLLLPATGEKHPAEHERRDGEDARRDRGHGQSGDGPGWDRSRAGGVVQDVTLEGNVPPVQRRRPSYEGRSCYLRCREGCGDGRIGRKCGKGFDDLVSYNQLGGGGGETRPSDELSVRDIRVAYWSIDTSGYEPR